MLSRFGRHRLADKRTVLIPNQWNGSVQQYYHFLLGYLAPVFRWTNQHPDRAVAVRDCGPMNRWFDLLRPQRDVEVMTVGDVLHVMAGNLQPHTVLRGMDFPDAFDARHITAFAEQTLGIATERLASNPEPAEVIVSDRASADEFFATPAAEWPESGSQKRSVPNLAQIAPTIPGATPLVIDGARTDIYEQIVLHSRARILVAQHGAALTNMMWMPPGSCVVEVLPPMPDDAKDIFRKLAHALGLHYIAIAQESVHASVDPDQLIAAVVQARQHLKAQ